MADNTENSLVETEGIPEIELEMEVFGMTQAEVDKTLSIEDCAADAKATGDAIADVTADLADAISDITTLANTVAGLNGTDIPITGEQDADSIQEAIAAVDAKTAEDIPLSDDPEADTIAEKIQAVDSKTGADIALNDQTEKSISQVISEIKTATGSVVRSINNEYFPDQETGDVTVLKVPFADNLWSDDTDEIAGSFRIRTTGGAGSISDGSAWIKRLMGDRTHTGYVPESFTMTVVPATRTAPAAITASLDESTFETKVQEAGTYTFSYTTEWSADLSEYGITVTNDPVNGDQITVVWDGETDAVLTVTAIERQAPAAITATVNMATFRSAMTASGTLNLTFTNAWNVDPATYGITITGTPISGDEIHIVYIKESRGVITTARFHKLTATGWNLYNHTVGYAKVVKYSDDYGYKVGGDWLTVAFSETADGTQTPITPDANGLFNVAQDGYVHITGGNGTNTYILTTWSDRLDGMSEFEAYQESTVDMTSLMEDRFPNGLLRVANTRDEIDFDSKTTISRIMKMEYTAANLAAAQASGRSYEYDETSIYVVRADAIVSPFTLDNAYDVSEYGLEMFDNDGADVYTEIRYGKNLKDKLRRSVVTFNMTVSQLQEMG